MSGVVWEEVSGVAARGTYAFICFRLLYHAFQTPSYWSPAFPDPGAPRIKGVGHMDPGAEPVPDETAGASSDSCWRSTPSWMRP